METEKRTDSHDPYRLVVEHGGQAIVVAQDGRFRFVNPKACEITGYTREEFLATPFLEFIHPEDRELVATNYRRRIRGEKIPPYAFRIFDKAGNEKWVEISGVPIQWEGRPATLNFLSDVTERRRAEQALQESENRFRTLVEQSLVGVCILEADHLTYANARYADIFGYSRDEILEVGHISRLVHPDDQNLVRNAIRDVFEGKKEAAQIEFRGVRKGGDTIYVLAHGTRTVLNGRPVILATALDVTETRRAIEALRESEARFRMMMETTRDALYRLRFSPRQYDYISPAIERLTGYTAEEINAIGFGNLVVRTEVQTPGADRLDIIAQKMKSGELEEWRAVYLLRDKRGNLKWISDHAFPWRDESGNVVGAVGILEDITELRKAEEALRESERRFRELFHEAPVGYHEIDLEGRLVRVNRTELELLGYQREEMEGRYFWEFCAEPEVWRERTLAKLTGAGRLDRNTESALLRKDGTTVPVLLEDRYLRNESGKIVGLRTTVQDIRELKKLQEQLLLAQRLETVGVLAGGVAHDFNNLLTVILGSAQLALAELPEGHPLRHDILEIQKAAERGATLTRQLLAFARKQVMRPRILNINEVVRGLESMLRRLIGEDIELQFDLAEDLASVRVDPSQLEQVIMNLAVNARDAMPNGGLLRIETRNVELNEEYALIHHPTKPGRYVCLAVSDTGVGMDEETRSRIFEPFFTTKEVGKGSGLGLSMVYGIVKQSDGYIWVYSEPGMGTTFKIYFPVQEEAVSRPSTQNSQGNPRVDGKTVLLVEDDLRVRELTQRAIARFGFRVLAAKNGEEALQLAREHEGPIDVIVSDVIMPGMSGPELVQQIKPIRPEAKVLFISGYPEASIRRHKLDVGCQKLLQKPFDIELLGKVLTELVEAE